VNLNYYFIPPLALRVFNPPNEPKAKNEEKKSKTKRSGGARGESDESFSLALLWFDTAKL
jgi:hypothetical protein